MTVPAPIKHHRRRLLAARNIFPLPQTGPVDRQLSNLAQVRRWVMGTKPCWRADPKAAHAAWLRRSIGPRGWLP